MARGGWGTSWRWQRRDAHGRWVKGGGRSGQSNIRKRVSAKAAVGNLVKPASDKLWRGQGRGSKLARSAVINSAVVAGEHMSYSVNPYKTSGSVTFTGGKNLKSIPTHRLSVSLTVGIAPKQGTQSVFEKHGDQLKERLAVTAGQALKSKSAYEAVRVATGNARAIKFLGASLSASGNRRRSSTTLRSSTPTQRIRAARKAQRDRQRKENAARRNLSRAQRAGVPSTVTAGRPQRRGKQSVHSELRAERASNRLKGGVSPSRIVGPGAPVKKAKKNKKTGGTYTK